ncbi:MAG: hypothetical protein PHP92_04090 [Candidatus Nanoarchaeia archaeon]|nr:hypothetical protein [Candidatus Nanoarchaeia archaeon]
MAGNNLEEAIQHIMGLTNDEINSIELARTSKGEPSWKIKIYCKPGDEDKALVKIKDVDEKLKTQFK